MPSDGEQAPAGAEHHTSGAGATTPTHRAGGAAALAVAAACIISYFVFVIAYATDVPKADEWADTFPFAHIALKGGSWWTVAWHQHLGSRSFAPNLIELASAKVDHLNLRHIMLFNAFLFSTAFVLLLLLVRRYLAPTPLGPLAVAALGLVWFSLGDVENILWGMQMEFFLLPLCLLSSIWLLGNRDTRTWPTLAIATVLALIAAFSAVAGFAVFAVNLLLILWRPRPGVRRRTSAILTAATGLIAAGLYVRHYNFALATALCPPSYHCNAVQPILHPLHFATYVIELLGLIIPFGQLGGNGLHELYGALLALGGIAVVTSSFLDRRRTGRLPLPTCLIVFGLLFDLMIGVSRMNYVGGNLRSEYALPQLLVAAGLVIWMIPRITAGDGRGRESLSAHAAATRWVAIFVVAGTVGWTGASYGIPYARALEVSQIHDARVVANLHDEPPDSHGCFLATLYRGKLLPATSSTVSKAYFDAYIANMRSDGLSLFAPSAIGPFVRTGMPSGLVSLCTSPGNGQAANSG